MLEKFKQKALEKAATKMISDDFSLDDFLKQLNKLGKIGNLSKMMPNIGGVAGRLAMNQINDKFIYRFQLCEDYIHYFNETKSEISQLYNMYNSNIIEIVEKNKKYNEMIDFLLEEYNGKFNEYKQKIKIEYPKNYVIQLIVSMIILQDNRSKTNLKFKEYLILELETQKNEIFNQTQLSDKINLNSSIMKECYNMNELINNLNENLEEGDIRYI